MQLAKVIGTVVSTQKSPSLIGKKLLIIRRVNSHDPDYYDPNWCEEVAADCVGAGEGDLVFVTRGSAARLAQEGMGDAVDLAIVGIVDSFNFHN